MRLRFSLLSLCFTLCFFCQAQKPFTGELLYSGIKVTPIDSNAIEKILIYAKDSLGKVIHFSTILGKQECINNLSRNKSILLVETTKGKFAIKTGNQNESDTSFTYRYKKTLGSKKIAGIRAKKMLVYFNNLDKPFPFYYTKKINAKYGPSFHKLPGLVVSYYQPTDHGMFRFELTEWNKKEIPLTLFSVPKDYQRVTLDEFFELINQP
jgi:GLPGLI family protein